jgi:hypothetical protein
MPTLEALLHVAFFALMTLCWFFMLGWILSSFSP